MRRMLIVHTADSASLSGEGIVDLDNGFVPPGSGEVVVAKQPSQDTAAITQALPLNQFEAGHGQVGDGKSVHWGLIKP